MAIASSILFILYLGILVYIGLKQSKSVNGMESFWMANRSLSSWRIAFCLAASWFGLSSFTGQAGWLYSEGMGALFYLAVPNFGAIFLVGVVFAKRIRQIPAMSQPEFLEMRYDSKIRPWLAIIILIAFAGYSAMEFIAMSYVFEEFMGWPGWIGAIVIVVITLFYVTLGGMNTVVFTEIIQYCLLFGVGALVGIGSIIKAISLINSGAVAGVAVGTSIFSIPTLSTGSWWNILGLGLGTTVLLVVAYLPGWSTEQSPWQRIWMAQDTKQAKKGALYGTLLNAIVYIFTILMAVAAWVIIGDPSAQAADFNSELVVYLLMKEVLPTWLIPIIIVGFMAAAMSNISNFATSSASNIAKDWYQRYFRPHASQKEMVWASRACIAISLTLGVIAGMVLPSILDAVFIAASFATCGYVVPIVGALYWRRGNTSGAVASFVLGSLSYLIPALGVMFAGWEFFTDPLIFGLGVSIVAYVVVSLVTAPPTTSQLLGFFAQDAEAHIAASKAAGVKDVATDKSAALVEKDADVKDQGERYLVMLRYNVAGMNFTTAGTWQAFVDKVLKNQSWVWLSGYDVVYKVTKSDMLSNVRLARGIEDSEVLLYCEPYQESVEDAKAAIAVAVDDLLAAK